MSMPLPPVNKEKQDAQLEREQKISSRQPQAGEGEPSREDYIEMRAYIRYNLYYGQKLKEIIEALLQSGWKREEVEKAYRELKSRQ